MYTNDDELLVTIAAICLILGVLLLPVVADRAQCKAKAVKQGLQFDYGIAQGCMVKHNGKWIDYDRLRYTEE